MDLDHVLSNNKFVLNRECPRSAMATSLNCACLSVTVNATVLVDTFTVTDIMFLPLGPSALLVIIWVTGVSGRKVPCPVLFYTVSHKLW